MADMIRVHYIRDTFRMNDRETVVMPAGLTVRQYAPSWWDESDPHHAAIVDGKAAEAARLVLFGSEVTFAVTPGVVAGVGIGGLIVSTLISTAVSLAVSYVIRSLVKPGKKQTARSERDSPTYSFLGVETSYAAEGQPVPVVYGEHRVGGVVINSYTKVQSSPPLTRLYLLIALSEGPVEAIGGKTEDGGPFASETPQAALPAGLEINGQQASDFAGIRAYVRMGSLEQEVVPGFEDTNVQTNVGQTLRNTSGALDQASLLSAVPGFPNIEITPGVYSQSLFATSGFGDEAVEFTMGTEADSWTAILSFPRGLFDIDDLGQITTAAMQVQAAVIEVDDVGTPLVSADWIALPSVSVVSDFSSSFQFELSSECLDASTYSPPVSKLCRRFINGTSNPSLETSSLLVGQPSGVPTDETEWTVAGWIRPRIGVKPSGGGFIYFMVDDGTVVDTGPLGVTTGDPGHFPVFDLSTSTSGFAVELHSDGNSPTPVNSGGPGKFYSASPRVRAYSSSGSQTHTLTDNSYTASTTIFSGFTGIHTGSDDVDDFDQMTWCHVAFTYKASAVGGPRLRFYINGSPAGEKVLDASDVRPDWSVGAKVRIGRGRASGRSAEGLFNDLRLYERELSQGEVQQIHNGLLPGFQGDINEPGIVEGWVLDANLTSYSGSSSNTLNVVGGGIDFIDPSPNYATQGGGTQDQRRGKYKVVVQRITAEKESTSQFGADQVDWDAMRLSTDQSFTYPGLALLGLEIKATDQLSNTQPRVTIPVKGRQVPVWEGGNPALPSFTPEWSQNPAWCALDLLTNRRYGLGGYYDEKDIDVTGFKELADYSDGYVYKGGERLTLADLTQWQNIGSGLDVGDTLQAQLSILKADAPEDMARWVGERVAFAAFEYDQPTSFEPVYAAVAGLADTRSWEVASVVESGTSWVLIIELLIESASDFFAGNVTDVLPDVSGTLDRVTRRFEYNAVHDASRGTAWDQLGQIMGVAHAAPLWLGGRLSVFTDKPRTPVALVNMANVKRDSFVITYAGVSDRPNVESVEFLDADLNWERSSVEEEDGDIQDPSNVQSYRPRNISVPGITNRAQAKRHAKHDILQFKNAKRAFQWEMALDGISFAVGDVVYIAHDLLVGTVSGKLYQDPGAAFSVYLDRPVELEFGKGYRVQVSGSEGSVETYTVNTASYGSDPGDFPVEIDVGDPLSLLEVPSATSQGLPYSFGETDTVTETASIVEVVRTGEDHTHRIRAIEYVDIYEEVDSIDDLAVGSAELGGASSMPHDAAIPDPPQPGGVEEVATITEGGAVSIAARIKWRPRVGGLGDISAPRELPSANRDGRLAIWVSPFNLVHWTQVAEVSAAKGVYELEGRFRAGQVYRVALQPIGRTGARRDINLSTWMPFAPKGIARPKERPTGGSTRVSGERTVVTLTGAESASAASWEARRGGWILGQPMGASATSVIDSGQGFVGTKTNAAGMERPRIYARAVYGNGQLGPSCELEEASPPAAGQLVNLVDVNMEDQTWSGTLTSLQVESSRSDSAYLPIQDRGTKLKWSGSSLTATYQPQTISAREPQWFYVQAHVDGYQESPITMETPLEVADAYAHSVTVEGPIAPQVGSESNVVMTIEERHTDASAFDGSEVWSEYRPGRYYARNMDLRVSLTRTSTDYDVRLRRMSIRATKVPVDRQDFLQLQVFGR